MGVVRRTAIIETGRVRLRPILMTTFALLAGMVPVALGVGEGAVSAHRSAVPSLGEC